MIYKFISLYLYDSDKQIIFRELYNQGPTDKALANSLLYLFKINMVNNDQCFVLV